MRAGVWRRVVRRRRDRERRPGLRRGCRESAGLPRGPRRAAAARAAPGGRGPACRPRRSRTQRGLAVLIALVAAFTLQLPAQSTASYSARAAAPLLASPAVTAIRADRSPALDGRLDDSVWALGPAVPHLRPNDPQRMRATFESAGRRILVESICGLNRSLLFDLHPPE